jgi:RHS repeat-associated protein
VTADGLLGSPLEYTSAYEYDGYGNLTHEKDPVAYSSNPTYYSKIITYDSNGMFPTQITNALNQSAAMTYEPGFGKILTETDANLQTTTYHYDEFGRIGGSTTPHHDIEYPDGSYKDYTYNIAAGNNYIIIETSGQPTVTTYLDNFGRKWTEDTVATDGKTIRTVTLYDNAGRIEQTSLPYYLNETSYWTLYHYDSVRGYLDRQTNPDSTFKTFYIDGFTETATDENNHTKTTVKDSLNRIRQITEATSGNTHYNYDIFDNLLNVTDPMGSVTSIVYDDIGRKVNMNDPYMGAWKYGYDQNGNLISQTDGKGQITSITYDRLNRIDTKTYSSENPIRIVDYVYDEERTDDNDNPYFNIGYLTTVTVTGGTSTQYNYNNMGHLANEQKIISSTPYLTDWHYDSAGRIDHIIYPDTNRTQYNYLYDPIGTLKQVWKDGSLDPLADFEEYNALGQVGSVSYKNGAGTNYDYYLDGSYRLDYLTTYDGSGEVQNFHYEFDNVGNIETITDNHNSVSHSFTYDEVNRLVTASASSSDSYRVYNQTFQYDLSGNIELKTGQGGYEVLGWQDTTKHIRPTAVNFNDQSAGIANRTIEYNQDNMPTEITYAGGSTTFLYYDGEGNRIRKEQQGSDTVIYIGEIFEKRGDDELSYIYANGKKFVTLTGTDEFYTHADHLGSTALTTDKNGNKLEEIGYLPFGAVLFRNTYNGGGWSSDYRYTGQEFDPEYSLYNYNARLYDPVLGRFISADLKVQDESNPQSLNRYVYCLNNPLVYTDPTGYYWGHVDGVGYVQEVGPPVPENADLENALSEYWESTYQNSSIEEGSFVSDTNFQTFCQTAGININNGSSGSLLDQINEIGKEFGNSIIEEICSPAKLFDAGATILIEQLPKGIVKHSVGVFGALLSDCLFSSDTTDVSHSEYRALDVGYALEENQKDFNNTIQHINNTFQEIQSMRERDAQQMEKSNNYSGIYNHIK